VKMYYCLESFNGSYSRVKAHLMQTSGQGIKICATVKPRDMTKEMEQAKMRLKAFMPRDGR